MKCAETTAESVACLKTAVFNQTTQISDEGHHEADKTLGIEIFPLSEVVIFSLLVFQISELTIRSFLIVWQHLIHMYFSNQKSDRSKVQKSILFGDVLPISPSSEV